MHIRITPLVGRPDEAMAELETARGLVSAYVMAPMDQQQPVLVTVWEAVAQADEAPVTAGGQDYAKASFEPGDDVDGHPAYGQIVYFGPRAPAHAEALERANRERISPAVRDVPGNLGVLVGYHTDGSSVVVALTAALQVIEDSQRAIMSTALLPGEDAALLTGPDRIQLAWVLAASTHSAPLPA